MPPSLWDAEGWATPGWATLQDDNNITTSWRTALTPPRRDPLAIDLDGDGIETVGIPTDGTSPILFDHNADGIRTGTGWLSGDDAWLVLDRDGNGTIDSGRELFGVDTQIAIPNGSTGTAADGFAALGMLDANADGLFDAGDAAFTQVRLWQDVNQDGVSQAVELRSLAQAGIASIGLTPTGSTTDLGNGNTLTGSATVTRTNGSTTHIDSVAVTAAGAEGASNLELASNPFYREFTDSIPLTEAAQALPEMGGSGWVRDLREAMSLEGAAADQLEASVGAFAAGSTRDAQPSQLDALLADWARSTGRLTVAAQAGDFTWQRELVQAVVMSGDTVGIATYRVRDTTMGPPANPDSELVPVVQFGLTDRYYQDGPVQNGFATRIFNAEGAEVLRRLAVLEVFNAQRFFEVVTPISTEGTGSGTGGGGGAGGAVSSGYQTVGMVLLADIQVDFVNQAYDALRESVYGALAAQTRLTPYLDSIELVIDEQGVRFDTAALSALLLDAYNADPRNGLIDLVDLQRYSGATLRATGFDAQTLLRAGIEALPVDNSIRAELAALDLFIAATDAATSGTARPDAYLGDALDNYFASGEGDDVLDGAAGTDILIGGLGADALTGGTGDDQLYGDGYYGGQGGDDLLDGGAGNDNLMGGFGSDTYLFGRGDGQDTISNLADGWSGAADPDTTKRDVLQFRAGIAASDVTLSREGDSLVARINGSTDQVIVSSHFYLDGAGGLALDALRFADGTSWDAAAIRAMVLVGSTSNDAITGYATADTLNGLAGDDRIDGRAGNDAIAGGDGVDYISGEEGDDILAGDAGNDTLIGGVGVDILAGGEGDDQLYGDGYYGGSGGDDVLDGGAGNDYLMGGFGSDTYLFGRDGGQDTIYNVGDAYWGTADPDTSKRDTLQLGAGIAVGDISLSRSSEDLVLRVNGGTDQINVSNHFYMDGAAGYGIDQVRFADGTTWDAATIRAMVLAGTAGDDAITGYATADTLYGLGGDDRIEGRGGNDAIAGGDGMDSLNGEDGDDVLSGDEGSDWLMGGVGADTLSGGVGDDQLFGDSYYGGNGGDDLLDGGAGNDYLMGGFGSDTYLFGRGDGQDTISNLADAWSGGVDPDATKRDVLQLREGIAPSDVVLSREGDSLVVRINDSPDQVTVSNHFYLDGAGGYELDQLRFADGTTWDVATIQAMVLQGTAGNDAITGYATADTLIGLAGDDRIDGRAGNDTLAGGDGADDLQGQEGDDILGGDAGNDFLMGGMGADTLTGGTGSDQLFGDNYYGGQGGDDVLDGGAGNDVLYGDEGDDVYVGGTGDDVMYDQSATTRDVYRFARGDGQDTMFDYGGNDQIDFLDGVASDQIWLRQVGSGLEVSIIGTDDHMVVQDWYSNAAYRVETLQTADGLLLTESRVQALVDAMASFAPPAIGETTLPPNYSSALASTIAANWQPGA